MRRRKFAVAAVFDTETCNLGSNAKTASAIPILYIDNDIRDVNLLDYTPDVDDNVSFYRYEEQYLEQLEEYVKWGKASKQVPIVCAYNLMFDLQSLMEELDKRYDIQVNAQSGTNVYTLDLFEKSSDKMVLRFWDTFHLDMRGLAKMGEIAGLRKATGEWDYDLIRTPETTLTSEELFYAKRDTQVIPMFLRFLLRTNDWMKQSDLGCRVLTKTSLVRQMAKREIGQQRITKDNGKKITVEKMFLELCKKEMPRTFNQYAVRKACFRGGYTFTSAAYASTIQRNVVSVDVTSMHHLFLNGRFIPENFKYMRNETLTNMVNKVLSTSRRYVVEHYHKPFNYAFHIRVKLINIRLKEGSAFEAYGIGLAPLSKFKHTKELSENEARYEGENALIEGGWHDYFVNGTFAFGKLYEADEITIHVNEIELWCMSRVYEWDSLEVIFGEGSMSFCRPPDYVTLQSNILYRMKDDNKFIANHYKEGFSYPYHIPETVPDEFKKGLLDGSLSWDDFNAYYISDTKGKFNGIYGTMAQDVYKPSYRCVKGHIEVDRRTIVTPESWNDLRTDNCRVLYTYGMRIVGGSRMHMVLAIERIYECLGNRVRVLGGDTDSMKISLDDSVTDEMVSKSLEMFEKISKAAIDETMLRVRKLYPKQASSLRGIGSFEIENEGKHYDWHIELWNKCRCSIDTEKHVHITCAGLSRPSGRYHIERFMGDLLKAGNKEKDVLMLCVGYNVFVGNEICHSLESHTPNVTDRFEGMVRDYQGRETYVDTHEVTCLYPIGRWLGETIKQANMQSVRYLETRYNRYVDTSVRHLNVDNNTIEICEEKDEGIITVMIGDKCE